MESSTDYPSKNQGYANRHVSTFLELDGKDSLNQVQVVTDGRQLTAKNLLQQTNGLTLTRPILVKDTPESIGMKVLKYPKRKVKVSDIANILGGAHPVDVIDVEHQEELDGWTLGDLVDYFEDPDRKNRRQGHTTETNDDSSSPTKRRPRRAAAKASELKTAQRPRVLNQISLEFSNTPLREKITSPQFVRDLDWIDQAWPGRKNNLDKNRVYPTVQYYCLTSAEGCYTDFHVDFGGTSVWYHVMSGQKEFCLIAPTKDNLKIYEEWLCSRDQAITFLPGLIQDKSTIIRISLKPSQTMIIPAAWIHGVYTPTDSIVLGGNFLHGLDIRNQLAVYEIEERTKVKKRFRFPLYPQLHFYVGGMYLNKLRRGDISKAEIEGCLVLHEALSSWWEEFQEQAPQPAAPGKAPNVAAAAQEAAQANNCFTNVDMLVFELKKEHFRITKDGICPNENYKDSLPESQDRPKLKLKLKSNDNPVLPKEPEPQSVVSNAEPAVSQSSNSAEMPKKIRLKLKTDPTAAQQQSLKGEEEQDPFRIVLSSSAAAASAVKMIEKPKSSKRVREDTEWYDEGPPEPEDEWMPSSSKRSSKKKTDSTTSKGNSKQDAKSTSARSRLMKRFR